MPACPKYILHSPLSDRTRLEAFVERCLSENASLIAIFGTGCSELEDIIDELVVGDGKDSSRFICTTSHPHETYDDVLAFVRNFEFEKGGRIKEARF